MKAIGFFCAVFFSMLVVFLVATGEIKRWFSAGRDRLPIVEIGKRGAPGSGKNIIELPFYNVEQGKRSFTIRAEFSQEDFQLETQIEDIRQLTLRDGTIEVPITDEDSGAEPPADAPEEGRELKNLVLAFDSAVYQRVDESGKRKGHFEVLLKDGKGTADDGTEFLFEEMIFSNESREGTDRPASTFLLRSTKTVSVRNPSLELVSPNGFRGTLRSHGLEDFTFEPPVSAVFDPTRPSVLKLEGAAAAIPLDSPVEPRLPAVPGVESIPAGRRVAISCQGPLSLTFEPRRRGGDAAANARTIVRFEKDVTIFPVGPEVGAGAIPPPTGNRFECQRLELELEADGQRIVPRKAIATWDGGRVRAFVQKERGGAVYSLDGDALEWILSGDASAAAAAASEAVLSGSPKLRGPNLAFDAERAVFKLDENKIRLETVTGTMDYAIASRGAPKARPGGDPWTPPILEEIEAPKPVLPAEAPRIEPRPAVDRPEFPERWDLKADEAEFSFARGPEAGEQALSGFVARSREADGVEIRSRAAGDGTDADAPPSFQVNGSMLAYSGPDRKLTIEGTPDVKPRFLRGEDSLEARKIHILLEEGIAWFEGDVRARIESVEALAGGGENGGADLPGGGDLQATAFDIECASLTVRRRPETGSLRDIWGRGTAGAPVRVTALGSPWTRFLAPSMYWDQERQVVVLDGTGEGGEKPAPGTVPGARIEVENGELRADRVQIDRKSWKAYLTDRVSIRVFDRSGTADSPAMEIDTGRAEVTFFPDLREEGPPRYGLFRYLRRIRALHALRSADRPIEIRGAEFTARSEECTWDAERRELRFGGEGFQEVEVLREDFRGPIRSREIAYDEAKNLVTFRGEVRGTLIQSSLQPEPAVTRTTDPAGRGPAAQVEPASFRAAGEKKPMAWVFDTSLLEIQLSPEPTAGPGGLVSVRARDKVYLRNDDLRVQLRGDDLFYEEATRKVRIFSEDGRAQTLLCDRYRTSNAEKARPAPAPPPVAPEEGTAAVDTMHKIVAQEIWLLLHENSRAAVEAGDPARWLLAQFSKDVIASFYVPDVGQESGIPGLGDTWRLVAEKLTLHIDPSLAVAGDAASLRKVIPWAVATGKVVFTAGNYQATADRAVYEDPTTSITLEGSPARLSRDSTALESAEQIFLRKSGRKIEYSRSGRSARSPVPGLAPSGR